ncbi:DUF1566 domain-containing protein [Photobacterium atrarenae]|uniref:DUF1566 domain-containing protein n=1 Tax=Photobacterium atrarenae TaxID=865757 RepID=A0ABY5GFT7_9GAMM|nr:DUF1566 domain-containing protein [Photobacterium atrarenae]UTV28130.1 DUF1566 domain-containing protein [Photobacterium atrarenae]
MLKKALLAVTCSVLMAGNAAASLQSCYNDLPNSAPDIRFQDNDNGTVTDLQTNLIWRRCLLGMTWNATTQQCDGEPSVYSWKQALFQTELNYQDASESGKSWRMPNIKELVSLREVACISPALNLQAFPGLFREEADKWEMNRTVWSATPHAQSQTILTFGLNDGMTTHFGPQDVELGVLLVKDGK